MSKSARAYGAVALALIGFPLLVALWGGASAVMAILLIGLAAYALAVCLLVACFWHRYQYGSWPIEFDGGAERRQRYPLSAKPGIEGPDASNADSRGDPDDEAPYRLSHVLQGWLRRFSSHA